MSLEPHAPVVKGINLLAPDRFELWETFIEANALRRIAEVGVYRGEFAKRVLEASPGIEQYVMIDPWRSISNWNKPANTDDTAFERYYQETMAATAFAGPKRVVLRGKTTEVADSIDDNSLDFVYVDGDHTLRGITIDLIRMFPKVREGGWLAGDDFCNSIWQHPKTFEPTLVFPFVAYFAEAHGLVVFALPHNQFALQKGRGPYSFQDLTGTYGSLGLLRQITSSNPHQNQWRKLARYLPSRLTGTQKS